MTKAEEKKTGCHPNESLWKCKYVNVHVGRVATVSVQVQLTIKYSINQKKQWIRAYFTTKPKLLP